MAEYNIDSIIMPNGETQEITAIVMPNGDEYTFSGGTTPTGNIDITQAGVTDVTNYATATVPEAGVGDSDIETEFFTQNNARKWRARGWIDYNPGGWVDAQEIHHTDYRTYNAVASNTTITPTESAQTIGGTSTMMEGAVTVNAIPSNYVGSGITQRSSTDLTASGATVTAPAGYYQSAATKTVASGTEGTPTATKSAVSNHSVTVTPSVTNSAGYIVGGTKTGTAVSVSASELVSGSETKTENGTYDVTNLAELVVNVQGGGTLTVATKTASLSAVGQTLSFTGLSGTPKYWFVKTTSQISSSGSTTIYYITDGFWDGTSVKGNSFRIGSTRRIYSWTSGVTQAYSGGTLTITGGSATGASPGQFFNGNYELTYVY